MAGMNPRPCPFCGGNEIVMESSNGEHWATCCQCEISGPREGSEPESILAWNTRRQERCAERCELQKAMDEFIGMNPPIETGCARSNAEIISVQEWGNPVCPKCGNPYVDSFGNCFPCSRPSRREPMNP